MLNKDFFFQVFYYKIPRLGSNLNLTQQFPNCSDNRDFPEDILCLFEYFGCQNIRKATSRRLSVGKDATSFEFSYVLASTYIN